MHSFTNDFFSLLPGCFYRSFQNCFRVGLELIWRSVQKGGLVSYLIRQHCENKNFLKDGGQGHWKSGEPQAPTIPPPPLPPPQRKSRKTDLILRALLKERKVLRNITDLKLFGVHDVRSDAATESSMFQDLFSDAS